MKVAGDSRRPHPRNTSVTDPRAAAAAPSEGVLRHDRRRGVPPSGADELRRENATRARGASAPRRQARREPGRPSTPARDTAGGPGPSSRAPWAAGLLTPLTSIKGSTATGLDGTAGLDAGGMLQLFRIHRRSGRPHADLIGGGLEARGSGIGTGSGGEGEGSRLPPRGARPTSTARTATAATSRRRGGRARFFAPPERPPRPRRARAGPYVCRRTSTPRSPRRLGARAAPLARPSRSPRPRPRRPPRQRGLQPTRNRRQVRSSCWGPVGATHTHTGLKATRTSPDVEPDATAGQAGAAARHPGRRRPREPVPPARGPIASSRAADAQARHLHSSRSTVSHLHGRCIRTSSPATPPYELRVQSECHA